MDSSSDYREPGGETDKIAIQNTNEWETFESDEDVEEDIKWDGSESELVMENQNERFEKNLTGIKLKYTISEKEVMDIFKCTEGYKKNCKLQRTHILIQSFIFVILLMLRLRVDNTYYTILLMLPLLAIVAILAMPILSMKKLARSFSAGKETNIEIFPDKILVDMPGFQKVINLDGTVAYEQVAGVIILRPKEDNTILIPIRAIEPEFLPDVQAMLMAGTQPKYEK